MKRLLKKIENEVKEDVREEVEEVEEVVEKKGKEINEGEFLRIVLDEIANKTYHLVGTFDEEQLKRFKEFSSNLYFYESDPDPTVQIRISSCGGQINALLGILSVIEDMKRLWECKIHCHIDGYAFSCGALLFLIASDIRTMGEHSQMMMHEMSYGINTCLSDHKSELAYSEKLQKRIDKMIEKNTGISQKTLSKWYKSGDVYFFKEDLEKLGILDKMEE